MASVPKPQVQLSNLVNTYKTVTSRLLRKEFAELLKPFYWKPYFWSRSYFICTVSERSHDAVTAYIKNQGINYLCNTFHFCYPFITRK